MLIETFPKLNESFSAVFSKSDAGWHGTCSKLGDTTASHRVYTNGSRVSWCVFQIPNLGVSKNRVFSPKMDGLWWKTLVKWMIWGYTPIFGNIEMILIFSDLFLGILDLFNPISDMACLWFSYGNPRDGRGFWQHRGFWLRLGWVSSACFGALRSRARWRDIRCQMGPLKNAWFTGQSPANQQGNLRWRWNIMARWTNLCDTTETMLFFVKMLCFLK